MQLTFRISTAAWATVLVSAALGQEVQPQVLPPPNAPVWNAPPVGSSLDSPPPGYVPFQPASPANVPFSVPPPIYGPAEYAPPSVEPPYAPQPGLASPESAPPRNDTPSTTGGDGAGNGGRGTGGMDLGGGGMGGPGMGGPGYGATWYPSRPVSGSVPEEDFALVRQSLSAGWPVWRDGGDMVMLSASVHNTMFFTDAALPDSRQPFPSELWNISMGTNYMHKFDNGWSGMVGINFGSASDKPFYSIHEMNVGFMSFLNIPVWDGRDAWRLMLMYSPVGNLNFPIPGVAYQWNPSDSFHASIGLPLSIMWRPVEDLTFNVSYMPLTTVNAKATYRLAERVFIYGGFESMQEAYLLADRENIKDRFMGFEKRLLCGIRWDIWQHATVDMSAGYAFDRYYGIGQNSTGNLQDQIDIAPGAYISTNLHIRF